MIININISFSMNEIESMSHNNFIKSAIILQNSADHSIQVIIITFRIIIIIIIDYYNSII